MPFILVAKVNERDVREENKTKINQAATTTVRALGPASIAARRARHLSIISHSPFQVHHLLIHPRRRHLASVATDRHARTLLGGVLEVRDEIGAVLRLLETRENHLRAGDVLLGVEEVIVKGLLTPVDALVLVGGGVRESLGGAGHAAEEALETGTLSRKVSKKEREAGMKRFSRYARKTVPLN